MTCHSHYEACPRCRSNGRDTRGDNVGVYLDGSKHCYSCGFHIFPSYFHQHQQKVSIPNEYKTLLPLDFTREVPAECWQWLLQYNLSYSYWRETIGYSPSEKRMVFRVGSPLQFSIGRYFGTEGKRKWYCWGDAHKYCEVVGNGESIVLVEDLISAHVVGQVATAIPLFGTNVHPCHLYYLIQENKPVIIWLDNDQEHKVKSLAMRLQLIIQNSVDIIITEKDPKYHNINLLKDKLNGI